jgi:hypothetical protein
MGEIIVWPKRLDPSPLPGSGSFIRHHAAALDANPGTHCPESEGLVGQISPTARQLGRDRG